MVYSSKLIVDDDHAADGYIKAAVSGQCDVRLKLRVIKDDSVLTFDLNTDGEYETFPLNHGNGTYRIVLYENVHSNQYLTVGEVSIDVKLNRQDAAFLVPNQLVNYDEDSDVVRTTKELCGGKSPSESFSAVKGYIKQYFAYDFIKAVKVQKGTLPDIDGTIEKRMGICQDLAAVVVAMLRLQGIPSKLVVGYADKNYHAWTVSNIDGEEVLYDPTVAVFAMKPVSDYKEQYSV